ARRATPGPPWTAGPGPGRSEDRRPVVRDADDGPALAAGLPERLLGAGRVVELPLGVVVPDEQAQERPVLLPREVEHGDVAVRVADGEQRPAARAAPDPDRLLRAVVEVVGLGPARDRAAAIVGGVLERGRAP